MRAWIKFQKKWRRTVKEFIRCSNSKKKAWMTKKILNWCNIGNLYKTNETSKGKSDLKIREAKSHYLSQVIEEHKAVVRNVQYLQKILKEAAGVLTKDKLHCYMTNNWSRIQNNEWENYSRNLFDNDRNRSPLNIIQCGEPLITWSEIIIVTKIRQSNRSSRNPKQTTQNYEGKQYHRGYKFIFRYHLY